MFVSLAFTGSMTPLASASIDPAQKYYLSNQYTLNLNQFEEIWIEADTEICENYGHHCESYWDREYDESVVVKQDEVALLELGKRTEFTFSGPRPAEVECSISSYDGEMFSVDENGDRQIVSLGSWVGFQPEEGVYEADLYIGCLYQVRNNSIYDRILAFLKPKVAHAAPYGDYYGTIRFSVADKNKPAPLPLTLPEKAAELAKQVIGADYLGDGETFGGKGWDSYKSSYVDVAQVFSGYNFWNNNIKHRQVEFDGGLDCSGLVEWAYNYSFDPSKSLTKNAVRVWSSDSQYQNNSTPILESELAKGDLLFLDKNNNNVIDHVAIYVGEFTYEGETFEIIEAFSSDAGIIPMTLEQYKARAGFTNITQKGSNPIRRVITSPEIAGQVKVGSPVDITVTDPEGITITPDTFIQTDEEYLREVPGELYYSEAELGEDGRPKDIVYWFKNKVGEYHVDVIPEEGTVPTDTYSLEFTIGDNIIKLAEDVPIREIPVAGYYVEVKEGGEIESSGAITSGYLLEKIRSHIQSFTITDNFKKPLLVVVDLIEKRVEVNKKLQEKAQNEKRLQILQNSEKAILKVLADAESKFSEKESQQITKKESTEFLKILTKVLLTFD